MTIYILFVTAIKINSTYLNRPWIKTDEDILLIEGKSNDKERKEKDKEDKDDRLNKLIETISILNREKPTLFVLDDIIANESLNKRRSPLLDLVIACRHRKHSLWFLTQRYKTAPKNLRDLSNNVILLVSKRTSRYGNNSLRKRCLN